MTTAPAVTVAGRARRVAPSSGWSVFVPTPRPHRFRRCHWVTVSARRIPAGATPAAVPQTQLLQSCVHGCGRHRTRILAGHWQASDVVHPSVPAAPRDTVTVTDIVGDVSQSIRIDGRDLARAVARYAADHAARQ